MFAWVFFECLSGCSFKPVRHTAQAFASINIIAYSKTMSRLSLPKAFTLIELMLVVGITAILMAAAYIVVTSGYKNQIFISEKNDAIEEAKRGVQTMTKEIRKLKDGDNGNFAIITAQDYDFSFYSDIDLDNKTERVRYFLDGTNFKKAIIKPTATFEYLPANETESILSAYILNQTRAMPIFTYFTKDYPYDTTPLSTPANVAKIKFVSFNLIVNVAPFRQPGDYVLESKVGLRNLREK